MRNASTEVYVFLGVDGFWVPLISWRMKYHGMALFQINLNIDGQ